VSKFDVVEAVTEKPRSGFPVNVGGVDLHLGPVNLFDGSQLMVAAAPVAGTAARASVEAFCAISGGTWRVRPLPKLLNGAAPPSWLISAPVAPTPTPTPQHPSPMAQLVPGPVRAASGRGWTADDLKGTGEGGDFGPRGGRSPQTGLTTAEMAMSNPPPRWADVAQTSPDDEEKVYPWEMDGWLAPGPSWAPPAELAKAAPVEDDEEEEEDAVVVPLTDAEVAAIAAWSDDADDAAVAEEVIKALWVKKGEAPTQGSAAYHIRAKAKAEGMDTPSLGGNSNTAAFHAILRTIELSGGAVE